MAELDSAGPVVCDAGPLIHLDELGCVELLRDFDEVLVPGAVWGEVQRHRPGALRRRMLQLERRVALPDASPELVQLAAALLLAPGEVEALQLMHEIPAGMLLTDDAAARVAAERLTYEVHGTIGVVVRAWRRGQRSKRQVLDLLRSIPRRSTLFIAPQLLAVVIDEVEKA